MSIATKKITFCGLSIALAFICSYIKVFSMPTSGSVTLLSMFFICMPGLIYGGYVGIVSSFAFACITYVVSGYYVSIPQIICDYFLAFGLMGACGFLTENKIDISIAFCFGCFIRFVFSTISGIMFFADYAPENINPIIYSITYNGLYIFAEMVITLILLNIPSTRRLLNNIRQMSK